MFLPQYLELIQKTHNEAFPRCLKILNPKHRKMKDLKFHLVVNPVNQEHCPEGCRAVLLLNGGLCKGYPKEMSLEAVLESVHHAIRYHHTADAKLKLTYNE